MINQGRPEQKSVCNTNEDDSWENLSVSEYEVVEKEDEMAESEINESFDVFAGERPTEVMTEDNSQNTIASSPNGLQIVQKVGARDVRQVSEVLIDVDGNVCEIIPSTMPSKNQIHDLRRKKLSIGEKGMMYGLIKVGALFVAVSYLTFRLGSYMVSWLITA